MILEINIPVNDVNFDKLSELGDFIWADGFVYMSTDKDEGFIYKCFWNAKISKITKYNYHRVVSGFARIWCKEKLMQQELTEFEKTDACQERLALINKHLDVQEGGFKIGKKKKRKHKRKKSIHSS